MADSMEADLERFPEVAAGWEALSERLLEARALLAQGRHNGWRFGTLAQDLGDQHDTFIEAMYTALEGGGSRTDRVGQLLRAVARDLGMTDAEQQQHLDRLRGEVLGS